ALEQALVIKDACPGSTVTVVTMGPPRASDVIREAMFRGADGGVLVTDRKFAGADTLATSYTLAAAIRKLNPDVIVAGRQAIDGDTAQVGPQVAEKLGLPQITYCEQIEAIKDGVITLRRRLESGVEVVSCPVPMVITVNSSAAECRPENAKMVLKYKHAKTVSEVQDLAEDYYLALRTDRCYLNIPQWGAADMDVKAEDLGLSGSPTKVKKIENIVFASKESKHLEDTDVQINELMKELIAAHTIG
ncbi:MAG: electron transfer flavoprotein subunit beta/FixA family protein, partial [Mucinivorans sp.]